MTTTTVLLRSLVRLCGADAAVVAIDGGPSLLAVEGLDAPAAAQAVACARDGIVPASGWRARWTASLKLASPARRATLVVFDRSGAPLEPHLQPAAHALAAELACEIDRDAASADAAGGVVRLLAPGIDSLNDAAAIIEWPAGAQPRMLHVNRAFETLLGFAADESIGASLEMLYGPLTDRERIAFMSERVRETLAARIPVVYYHRDGLPMWVEVSLRGVPSTAPSGGYVVATMRDVSARKEFEFALAKEKRKLQVTLAAIGDGVITTVADGRVDYVNLAARAMLDLDAAEAYGKPIAEVLPLREGDGAPIDVLLGAADAGDGFRGQAQYEREDGHKVLAYVSSPIADEGFVVVLRDVTDQQRLSTRLSYEASHDPLTGIYNRRKFDHVLLEAIGSAQRRAGPHALALLDLDRFKRINDDCGHAAGDRVLTDVARLLQTQLRERDVVARMGGDEFAVLLHDCSLDNARRVFANLQSAVEGYRITFAGREYGVGVSLGMAVIDGSEKEAGAIVAHADAACYAAKARGRDALAT